jgi:hypothetical protein
VYINGSKGLSTSAKPDAPVPDASYPTSFPANAQDFDNNIGTFKKNGGTIINLCSRIMRVRSHAESTKNAANRVQSDNDKLAIFIFSKERKLIRISYPRNDEAIALVKKVHTSHAILLLEMENFIGLECPGGFVLDNVIFYA